jgi:ribonucleotide reductase beta subunit family protein with ferritin-like domain
MWRSEMTETKQLTKDRNYYRMLSDAELIAYAKSNTQLTELEVVLAERLKEARRLHHI